MDPMRITEEFADCPKQCSAPSIADTLQRKKLSLEDQLTKVNAAIAGLEKHPEVKEVLELIAQARHCG